MLQAGQGRLGATGGFLGGAAVSSRYTAAEGRLSVTEQLPDRFSITSEWPWNGPKICCTYIRFVGVSNYMRMRSYMAYIKDHTVYSQYTAV